MIDINELRRLLNSTDMIDGIDLHANIKPIVRELLNRLEAAERERDALRAALEKIADWNGAWGPYPERNKAWCAMALVTAREAVRKEYF